MVRPVEGSARLRSLSDWLAWQETLHPSAIDLGLERLQRTLARLNWQRLACPVITVAGTNGKGSCVALTARILGEAGYRVGTFTSPAPRFRTQHWSQRSSGSTRRAARTR
jgi:folylpolyglutamate synthase/dihydropteroate synthase